MDAIDLNALAAQIAVHLEKAGLINPRISVTRVPVIERTAAGKLKRYVPL